MNHSEVVLLEEMGPSSLLMIEILGFFEVGEILMVGEDLKRVDGVDKVVTPFLQGENDGSHLQVCSMVILFCVGERMRDESDRVPDAILLLQRTAPRPTPEPSVSTLKGSVAVGMERTGAVVMAVFKALKGC